MKNDIKDFLNHISDSKILNARYMNTDEISTIGVNERGLILLLDNGIKIYAISTDGKAASIVAESYRGKTKIKPIEF